MRMLDRKLLRDLRRLWAQALAIALVVASGFATLILGVGSYRSLFETRAAYYERNAFADVFSTLVRAPKAVGSRILDIPGVAAADLRIMKPTLIDIESVQEPASGLALSLPDNASPKLSHLYMRVGRTPEPGRIDEIVVNEAFANANRLEPGSHLKANLNGRKRELTVVGIALSPEFIYAISPGEIVPDDRRYGTLWMSEKALAALFDLEGAFNAVALKLLPGANQEQVIAELDRILGRYGGVGAHGRDIHQSHAFIDSELNQLSAMSRIIPPIFLVVTAFLMNITLSRLIALEREQIGLLKAIGYSQAAVALHYLKLALAIAIVGSVIGAVAGTWLGKGMASLYSKFFHFPFLIFKRDPDIYLLAAAVCLGSAALGAFQAVYQALALAPAVAMQPPSPPRYRKLWSESLGVMRPFSQLTVMALRYMVRGPVRAGTTLLGVALATSLLITSLFTTDSVEFLIDVSFFQTSRQHATVNFTTDQAARAVQAVEHLPGVLRAETFRSVSVRLRNGHLERRTALLGRSPGQDLSLLVDNTFHRVEPPESGLLIGTRLAQVLDLKRGDTVEIELLQGRRDTKTAIVSDVVELYFGLGAFMDIQALNELVDDGPRISGVNLSFDSARESEFYDAVKKTPAIASLTLQRVALAKFRETIGQNIDVMATVYVTLSVIIAFGVVYNSARIQLSERARELASLRVLGFTRREVSRVLLVELVILILLAQPLGWMFGHILAWSVLQGFASDLFTVPFIIETRTYAFATLIVVIASALSALAVRRRIDTLDLIAVLKTRD